MKGVTTIINEDGSVRIEYDGFAGEACFTEAKKIYEKLRTLGINASIEKTGRKPDTKVSQLGSVRQ